jgi:hypothetical protein
LRRASVHWQDWAALWATALAGGTWGALLARVLFELWPLWFSDVLFVCSLCGALALPLLLRFYGHVSGGPMAACAWPLALGAIYLLQPTVAPLWGGAALVAGLGGLFWLVRHQAPSTPCTAANPPAAAAQAITAGWLWEALAFLVPLAVYVATLAPSVLPGDSGEFQFVAPTLGIPHPTGYPFYLLLGKLFSTLPIGSVAYRLNLLSAFAAAGAVWATYRAGCALGLRRSAALVGAGLLLVSETFWGQATIAEKYALNAFFVALTLWLGLQWRAARIAGRSGRGWMAAWSLCYGLSLTHHRTMILLAPVYLGLVGLIDRKALALRRLWRPVLLCILPWTLYLLLPILSARNPPYAYLRIDSLRTFLDLVLARTYESGLFRGGWAALPGRLADFGGLLVRQFGPTGLALSVLGWAALLWRERHIAWVLLAGVVVQIAFALNYYVPNTPVYYVPAYVWLAACAPAAVDAAQSALADLKIASRLRPHLVLAWTLLVAALPVALCVSRWQGMDQRRAYDSLSFDHTYAQVALRSVAENALVVSDWQPATVLWYGQWVEGLAPGAQIVSLDSLEWQWKGVVERALAAGRPVYLSRPVVTVPDDHPVRSAGPLVQVLPAPVIAAPEMPYPLHANLGEVALLGYNRTVVAPGPEGAVYRPIDGQIDGGSALHVTLYWQALRDLGEDYAVTLRLVDADGNVRIERQSRHPVGGTYPTSRWQEDEVVADAYVLDLPAYLPSGAYHLRVTMGAPFAPTGLTDLSGSDQVLLDTVQVRKPLRWSGASPGVPVRRRVGRGLLFMGYDAPRGVTPGETVRIALQWLVIRNWEGGYPGVRMPLDSGESITVPSLLDVPEDWRKGALIVQEYVFVVPEDQQVQQLQASLPLPDGSVWTYTLPLRVADQAPPVANFGGRIRLRSYAYASRTLEPGDTVRLTLEWEAVTTVDEPFKVFVHVLGQDGLPVAQQDNEPVNGTYPTTRWQRGERISDPYAFALPGGLPPGEYQVEVGLYRPADFSRLPVLDRAGNVVDDKVFLPPLTVE